MEMGNSGTVAGTFGRVPGMGGRRVTAGPTKGVVSDMMRAEPMRIFTFAMLGLAATGCGSTGPSFRIPEALPGAFVSGEAASLVLTATISKPVFAIGDTATLVLTVRNATALAVTLHFSSTCQVLPFIWDATSMVHPQGGGWGCGAALTQLTIAPGASHVRSVVVHGGVLREPQPFVALNPGEHYGYLELGDRKGRSAPVRWVVSTQ